MKLLTITNRYYFISILLFFIVAGVILFFLLRYHLDDELNEQLLGDQQRITFAMLQRDTMNKPQFPLRDDLTFQRRPLDFKMETQLFDTLMYDKTEKDIVPFRMIRFTAKTRQANYLITVKRSMIETDDLVISILISLMVVIGLFSLILLWMNSYFSKKLWSPFLNTIMRMKSFDINKHEQAFQTSSTRIQEFTDLNTTLEQMISRIQSDYFRMKEFSENAAHELQTPIAIINTKLESLLQTSELNEESAGLIQSAMENSSRMSKLIQTLLMLTKIENRQFDAREKISMNEVIKKYLNLYDELIREKKLKVEMKEEGEFVAEVHPQLADILISNLISNAIRHNKLEGSIHVSISPDKISISNSGNAPAHSTQEMFARFKKGNQSSEHLGLGLSLVKEIVQAANLSVQYTFHEGEHVLELKKK